MKKVRISTILGALFLGALSVLISSGAIANGDDTRVYRVTITNTTSGQPLSPPVVATHASNVSVFAVGAPASRGVWTIAENGDNSVLQSELSGRPGVYRSIATMLPVRRTGGNGPDGSGTSLTVTIEARPGDVLSVVAMLGCTNDGFAGVASMTLPEGFTPVGVAANGYDAGTEVNTERSPDLADGCGTILGPNRLPADGNMRVPTSANVTMHPGLNLGGDLTGAAAWYGSPMQVFVQRIH